MGWFSSKNNWEEEYDRRVASGEYRTDKMSNFLNPFRPSETRVADDEGTMRRRNGEGCCGCGKWSSETYKANPQFTPTTEDHPHDHHHDDQDDGPKLLWGLF